MAQINFNDFLATQTQSKPATTESRSSGVGFFSLKNDKDFAIVRFMHDSTDDFDIVAGHRMTVNDKPRMVNCIREAHDDVVKCPLCAAGKKLEYRLYIHLIEYVRNDNGKMVPVPRVWERSAQYVKTLTNLMKEYGPLSDSIFKITRNGEKGSKNTTYDIMYGNPKVYPQETYPRRDDAFTNYKVVGNIVLDYDYDKLVELAGESSASISSEAPIYNQSSYKEAQSQMEASIPTYTTPTTAPNVPTTSNQGSTEVPVRPRRFY